MARSDYKSGEIYLDGRKREMIATAILTQIKYIADIKAKCDEIGLCNDFGWTIQNYQAILKEL